jgi:hypothetical protein
MPEIQDGITGLKHCGVERFGHETFFSDQSSGKSSASPPRKQLQRGWIVKINPESRFSI